jgi:hypothetical protein
LLDFVKDILIKYPQVKNDLSEDKVVENLIVTYLSDLPKSSLLTTSGTGSVLEIYREGFNLTTSKEVCQQQQQASIMRVPTKLGI